MVKYLQARAKAIAAAIGVVAMYLNQYNVTHPNHWVTVVLGILTVLGVHQITNK